MNPTRDQIIAAAVRVGKIAASRTNEYRRMYNADPKAIRRLLTAAVEQGGLMPGITMPVPADAYPADWINEPGAGRITSDA